MIYHITSRDAWEQAKKAGLYRAASLDTEGFIHCSRAHQVTGSANRFFQGQDNLVVLEIDPARLTFRLVYEASEGQEVFPHIYSPLDVDAIRRVIPLEPDGDGMFSFEPW